VKRQEPIPLLLDPLEPALPLLALAGRHGLPFLNRKAQKKNYSYSREKWAARRAPRHVAPREPKTLNPLMLLTRDPAKSIAVMQPTSSISTARRN